MPKITFITNDGKTVDAPEDQILLRVSMRYEGGIPYKCCGGMCGTCKCLVEEGRDNLAPPTKKELKLLSEEDLASGHRLACQSQLTGPVSVSWIPLDQRKK